MPLKSESDHLVALETSLKPVKNDFNLVKTNSAVVSCLELEIKGK